ncbi:MAG TPA: hypothetical protein VFH88_04565 [Candidatus Krumholzibacteria bacterium]|nr:hypothetical protein [Candidatus Krumholzibacteria bacterium]
MHGRIRRRYLATCLGIAAAASLSACATAPPSRTETEAIHELRADYLRQFPEGPNNDHVRRGEVVKGMSLYEVLASWGVPDARSVSQKDNREVWTYVLMDDLSLDWLCYEYEFRNNAVTDWTVSRNISSGMALYSDRQGTAMSLPSWAGSNASRVGPVK